MQWSHCNDSSVGPPLPSSPTLTEAPKGIQFSFLVSASHPLTWFPLPSLCWSPMTVSPTQTHFSMSWAIVLCHRRKADKYNSCLYSSHVWRANLFQASHPGCPSSLQNCFPGLLSWCYICLKVSSFAVWCSSTCSAHILLVFQICFCPIA